MDIYVYSDESGVFDRQHNEYFVFSGLVALSYSEADEATRRYQHAEKLIKAKEGLANDDEAKACCLSNSGKSKLFRSLNNFHKFGVVIHQNRVNPNIFNNKKTKQRYLDYAFKIAIKRKFEALIREGTIEPCKVSKIRFYVDEHATATDGRYELREALEQEFKIGTFNLKWSVFHEPIFPNLQSVELHFCDSKSRAPIRAADIIANRIYFCATSRDLNSLRGRKEFKLIELP